MLNIRRRKLLWPSFTGLLFNRAVFFPAFYNLIGGRWCRLELLRNIAVGSSLADLIDDKSSFDLIKFMVSSSICAYNGTKSRLRRHDLKKLCKVEDATCVEG